MLCTLCRFSYICLQSLCWWCLMCLRLQEENTYIWTHKICCICLIGWLMLHLDGYFHSYIYTQASKPNHPICVLNIVFCVSPHWLVTWHCMYSRLYHIMIFIKLNDMFTQKNLIVTRNVSLNLLFLKQSSWSNIKNLRTPVWQWSPTCGNIFAYTFFHQKDISNLQYWWSYVWNQQKNQCEYVMQWNLECIACTTSQADRLNVSHQFTNWSNF